MLAKLTAQFACIAFNNEHCVVSKRSSETSGGLSAEYFHFF
jgi:hypothetical protein